jgi:hypothetical protein
MLYNPDWKTDTKVDPLSLTALIAWLETKHQNETYDYISQDNCVLGQWTKHCDLSSVPLSASGNGYNYQVHGVLRCFDHLHDAVISHPRTFGAFLKRVNYLKERGDV